jgi:hypothetical protein
VKTLLGVTFVALLSLFAALPGFTETPYDTFLGTWEGPNKGSGGDLDVSVTISNIQGDEAEVVYRWGTNPMIATKPGESKWEDCIRNLEENSLGPRARAHRCGPARGRSFRGKEEPCTAT